MNDLTRTCLLAIAVASTLGRPALAADPTTADCLAASDASLKLGNEHRLRAERAQLLVCAAPTCPADIRKECLSRVDEVNPQIPTIVFLAKDSKGADLSDVKVSMDGDLLAGKLEGAALSIDPGEHTFTFETAGQEPVTKKLLIVEGQKDRRELVTFGGAEAAPPAPLPAAPPPAPPAERGLGTQKILALAAGGAGVIGVGLGTAFGLIAMSKKSDAQNACPHATCPTQAGSSDWSDAGSAGNVSTIGFVVGGIGLAGAAALWFTAPSGDSTPSAQVGLGPRSIQLKGSW